MNDESLAIHIEGLLFALGKPLSRQDISTLTGADDAQIASAVRVLATQQGRGVVVVDDGKMLELRVAPAVFELVQKVRRDENSRDIGRAGLEVVAAILYRGPLTRAEIDFIRGVNSSQILRTLTMRGLVRRITNPKDAVQSSGRQSSFLYEATTELLSTMGATHPRDLPDFDLVRQKIAQLEASYRNTHANESPDI